MNDKKQLIENILAGDINLFQQIIEEHKRLVIHVVYRMIDSNEDREDICQDVFMKVYQNLNKFKHESKLSTWIATVAYNRCINFYNKKKALLYNDHSMENETLDSVKSESDSPEDIIESKDITSQLQQEIEKLPVQFRTIITLYHLNEMKYSEICKIMNLPTGTVKSYLFRARKLLKERLAAKYPQEELCE